MPDFEGLYLAQPLLRAIAEEGYTDPTPIQARTIPALMEGRDLIGIAQTGTGKTAAFSLPMLHQLAQSKSQRLKRATRALVLAPTRELATQIFENIKTYNRHLKLKVAVAYGGVSIRGQISALHHGVDILVATPGRLLDLKRQGCVRLDRVEFFVLDEADRMLDMGFAPDVKQIAAELPKVHQSAMFSATMAKTVRGLVESLLDHPTKVEVAPVATTVDKIDQRVMFVAKENKRSLLAQLMSDKSIERVFIFTRAKYGADRVARDLERAGVKAGVIHGNRTQNQRERAIKAFKGGGMRALVATDIASRGIDVDGITHVINYDLPNEPDTYVHRIGRTGRAGAIGSAISFCEIEDKAYLLDIEKTIRLSIEVVDDHPFHDETIARDPGTQRRKQGGGNGRSGGRRRGNGGGKPRRQGAAKSHRRPSSNVKKAA